MIPAPEPPELFPYDPKDLRCRYCGAVVVAKATDDPDLIQYVCPNDSGSLHPCPKVLWSLKVDPGRGITFSGQLDVDNQ